MFYTADFHVDDTLVSLTSMLADENETQQIGIFKKNAATQEQNGDLLIEERTAFYASNIILLHLLLKPIS